MSTLIDSEHIIATISAFYEEWRDYDTIENVVLEIGAEILDVSIDKLLDMME